MRRKSEGLGGSFPRSGAVRRGLAVGFCSSVSSLEVLKAGVPINEMMHYSPVVVTAFSALHLFPALE